MTATEGRNDGRGFRGRIMVSTALALLPLSVIPSFRRLSAQDTTRATPPAVRVVPTDTVRGIRPMGAFWRSVLVPGWGQAATGRHTTGAVFVAWEGVTAMMTLKAEQEANYMKASGATGLTLKRQEVQDWLVLWVFNHLFAGAEAYVSAHLQDFPRDLHLQATPHGIGISIPLRGRP
jgi:hypothetical protein